MKLFKVLIMLIATILLPHSALANVAFSGYGSIVAGKTFGTVDDPLNPGETRDEVLTADFYDVGQYDNDIKFTPESVFALQALVDVGYDLKFTAQLVAKGTDDFEPEFDWYYLSYQVNDSWSVMAGRRNIPMYYYSEFSEVGYAYPWMRPPSNLYWWQITQFNSFQASYDFELGDYSNNLTFFYGNENSYGNKEMLFYDELFGGNARSIDEIWSDILGFNWSITGDDFEVRFVYFQNDRDRTTTAQDGTETDMIPFDQQFLGVGGYYNFNQFTFLFDWNHVEYDDVVGTEYPTYLVSLVYNIGDFQPYIAYSKADHENTKTDAATKDLEEHYILGYGVRYNFHPSASFKVQYDKFEEQGHKATGWAYHGDSRTLTFGIDFIF